jgi:predicted N-formylglutamate amidohydrolase
LSPELRADLLRRYHRPHWRAVERRLARMRAKGSVLHLGVHSFAPVLRGQVRTMDVGLLYDPGRAFERRAVGALRAALQRRAPQLVVRRNAPYRGVADGLTSALRKVHSDAAYAGIELEINNRWLSPTPDAMMVAAVLAAVADALERLRRG